MSSAEEGFCQGAEAYLVASLSDLPREVAGSLSWVTADLGRDSDVIETVLGYSRVENPSRREWVAAATRLDHGDAILPAGGVFIREQAPACSRTDTGATQLFDHRCQVVLTDAIAELLSVTRGTRPRVTLSAPGTRIMP